MPILRRLTLLLLALFVLQECASGSIPSLPKTRIGGLEPWGLERVEVERSQLVERNRETSGLRKELRRAIASFENRLLFQGRELDPATGLYDYRSRVYSPELGRFLQADSIGLAGGPNLYAFENADPVNNIDPMGTESVSMALDPTDDFAAGGWWSLWGGAKWFVRSEWNGLTFNFLDRHDPARDAYDDGLIRGTEYLGETGKATAQSGVGIAATAILPGLGGRLAVASGVTRVGTYATGRTLGYAVQGATIGGGSRLASDISAKLFYSEDFSSPAAYALSTGGGTAIGAALGAAVTRYPALTNRIGGTPLNARARGYFRSSTRQAALSRAPLGADGGPVCEGCEAPIGRGKIQVGNRLRVDYDLDHFQRTVQQLRTEVPGGVSRPEFLSMYNQGVRPLCPSCNVGHRLEPLWRFIGPTSFLGDSPARSVVK